MSRRRPPLPAPVLDDRTFDDLLREARARAARYMPDWSPEWSDHNASDPGTTLLELFAWFTELMVYRLNQVPELHYARFLDLLGLRLRPPACAQTELEFKPLPTAASDTSVPAGSRLAGPSALADGQVFFETLEDLRLLPHPLRTVRVFNGRRFLDHTTDQLEAGGAFLPFGPQPDQDCALYLGFGDLPRPDEATRFPSELRLQLSLPARGQARHEGTPSAASTLELRWEYASPRGDQVRWLPMAPLTDETGGLRRTGALRLQGPPNRGPDAIAPTAWAEYRPDDEAEQELLWIRCRIAAPVSGHVTPPRVARLQPNTVPARQWLTVTDERLLTGDGQPDQTARLRNHPVVPGSLVLEGLDPRLGQRSTWRQVEDMLDAGPDELVFHLDEATGVLHFGNNRHGRAPWPGLELTALRYRFGGGRRGNVPAHSVEQLLQRIEGVAAATNPEAAHGGRDGETVQLLTRRAPQELRARSRAVAAGDYESLAQAVDGVAQARTLPLRHPGFPGERVPGCVSLVVVPHWNLDAAPDQPPEATPDLLERVADQLEPHRPVATELHVVGPRFRRVDARATLVCEPGSDLEQVARDAAAALDALLVPQRSSLEGPVGEPQGWSLGATLSLPLLVARWIELPGVQDVRDARVLVGDVELQRDRSERLPDDTLAWPGQHDLRCLRGAPAGSSP